MMKEKKGNLFRIIKSKTKNKNKNAAVHHPTGTLCILFNFFFLFFWFKIIQQKTPNQKIFSFFTFIQRQITVISLGASIFYDSIHPLRHYRSSKKFPLQERNCQPNIKTEQ